MDSVNSPCPVFKRQFHVSRRVKKAVLYITAHGLYEAKINGHRVGNDYFTPGWTSYDKRLLYQTYDVTSLLHPASPSNEIIATVGDGWYRGIYGNQARKNNYGKDASLLCKLIIDYYDTTQDVLVSDGSWLNTTGPIRRSSIYFGELYDASITHRNWVPVRVGLVSQVNLQPYNIEPVKQQEHFAPQRIFTSPKGEKIIDFGQNMAGWVQLRVKGRKGDTVKICHAETLDKNGNFFLVNMLKCDPTDIYIFSGKGIDTLEPHFTYHGFRYARVEGFTPTKDNCTAIALHSSLRHAGSFACSNELINQLQHNIEWSLNSNLFEIPTDCPQRGERLGWTGDAQVIFRTAAFNRDLRLFFDKWLLDLALDQAVTGSIPKVIPDTYSPASKGIKRGVAGWGDAATIVPMDYFTVYGDTALLLRQYPSMKAWARYELSRADPSTRLWTDWGYGDWLAVGAQTDSVYIDQAFMIHSIDLVLQAAEILHLQDPETPALREALRQCKEAYWRTFLTNEGLLNNNTQTAYVLALQFNLLPDSLRDRAVAQLVKLIHDNNDHLATGFLGTPYLLHVLSNHHNTDLAYTLLGQETVPSWLYSVKKGATTIWERWDAIKPDGEFDFYSLNHYAYGAVGDWLYKVVAGIQPIAPGYKRIRIEPHPGGGLTWAKGTYQCSYGRIVSQWTINGDRMTMEVEIPQGAEATIVVPGNKAIVVSGGHYHFETAFPVTTTSQKNNGSIWLAGLQNEAWYFIKDPCFFILR
jgi:alpha-L-rhamnosidase